jgi:hypothetical protein
MSLTMQIQDIAARAAAQDPRPESLAALVETLTAALAFTIVLSARGNSKLVGILLEGTTELLHQACADKLASGRTLGSLLDGPK